MNRSTFLLIAALVLCGNGGMYRAVAAETATPAKPIGTVAVSDIEALRSAASRNEAWAQYDLGVALSCGRGVVRNRAEAALWLGRAAEQGHAQAQSMLGWMYMTGSGVRRDDARALRWLSSAAEQGNTVAQNNLGIVYVQGRGVPIDRVQAEKWFRKATDQGAADAARNLDILLKSEGRQVRPSTRPPIYPG